MWWKYHWWSYKWWIKFTSHKVTKMLTKWYFYNSNIVFITLFITYKWWKLLWKLFSSSYRCATSLVAILWCCFACLHFLQSFSRSFFLSTWYSSSGVLGWWNSLVLCFMCLPTLKAFTSSSDSLQEEKQILRFEKSNFTCGYPDLHRNNFTCDYADLHRIKLEIIWKHTA